MNEPAQTSELPPSPEYTPEQQAALNALGKLIRRTDLHEDTEPDDHQ